MHPPALSSTDLGFLPAMYSFSSSTSPPEFDLGSPSTAENLSNNNKYVAHIEVLKIVNDLQRETHLKYVYLNVFFSVLQQLGDKTPQEAQETRR